MDTKLKKEETLATDVEVGNYITIGERLYVVTKVEMIHHYTADAFVRIELYPGDIVKRSRRYDQVTLFLPRSTTITIFK